VQRNYKHQIEALYTKTKAKGVFLTRKVMHKKTKRAQSTDICNSLYLIKITKKDIKVNKKKCLHDQLLYPYLIFKFDRGNISKNMKNNKSKYEQ
jgi:hypothetical protein